LPPNKSVAVKFEGNVQFAVTTFKSDDINADLLCAPITLSGREQGLLLDYFYTASQIFGDKPDENLTAKKYCYSALQTFLLRIILSNAEKPKYILSEKLKTSTHVNDQKITVDIKKHLENRLFDTITIEELSQTLGVSKNSLMKIFKADTGKSIMEYFTYLKMQHAQKLIVEGNLSFRTISEKLGFASPEYFSRIFKKHTGFTPTEFSINATKWHGCLADFC
jgi:AraC-like DNA-binding protein